MITPLVVTQCKIYSIIIYKAVNLNNDATWPSKINQILPFIWHINFDFGVGVFFGFVCLFCFGGVNKMVVYWLYGHTVHLFFVCMFVRLSIAISTFGLLILVKTSVIINVKIITVHPNQFWTWSLSASKRCHCVTNVNYCNDELIEVTNEVVSLGLCPNNIYLMSS